MPSTPFAAPGAIEYIASDITAAASLTGDGDGGQARSAPRRVDQLGAIDSLSAANDVVQPEVLQKPGSLLLALLSSPPALRQQRAMLTTLPWSWTPREESGPLALPEPVAKPGLPDTIKSLAGR
jgi:hypothetical protein